MNKKSVTKVKCPVCDKEFSPLGLSGHTRIVHEGKRINQAYLKQAARPGACSKGTVVCDCCGKEVKSLGLAAHKRLAHTLAGIEFRRKGHEARKGGSSWNEGKTSETDERIKRVSNANSKRMLGKPGWKHTEECKQRISRSGRANGISGGYRKGSGRGKKGWFKGYWCDSSWELAWVIYSLEHGVKFERNWKKFTYETIDGKEHKYLPDFYIPQEAQYIEVKGYCADLEVLKRKTFSLYSHVLVVDKIAIAHMLYYVETKYGKDFIKLYE